MSKNKVTEMPRRDETAVMRTEYPELFLSDEVINYGEVLSTTESGQIFVMNNDKVYLFQPVASRHFNHEEHIYNRLEFK